MFLKHDGLGVDSHTLGGVVSFVDADETIGDLKHVVPQGDDDELGVLCLLLHRDEGKRKKITGLKRDCDLIKYHIACGCCQIVTLTM